MARSDLPLRRHRRGLHAALLLAVCVLAANVVAVGLRSAAAEGNRSQAGLALAARVGDALPEPEPVTVEPAPPLFTLSQPIRIPDDSYADEPEIVLGRVQVPALGLDAVLYQGVSLTSIDRGPAHWPGTALPGHVGNTVLAGHRVTHSHPFRDLDRLVAGDQAVLTTADGTFTYEFVAQEVVTPDRVDIADQHPGYTATFYACHPPGSARYRIVAHWRMVSPPAPGQPSPAELVADG